MGATRSLCAARIERDGMQCGDVAGKKWREDLDWRFGHLANAEIFGKMGLRDKERIDLFLMISSRMEPVPTIVGNKIG